VILAQFQDLGIDEALDQTKDIGVGAALYLADEPLFIGRQGRERIRQRKARLEETCGRYRICAPGSHPCRCPNEPAWTFECSAHTDRCCHGYCGSRSFQSPFAEWCADGMDEPIG
jgi:hypothetical protein